MKSGKVELKNDEELDKQKSKRIKMVKIMKGLSYIFILLTVFLFSMIYIALFTYPEPVTTNELLNALVFTTLIFLIFIAISLGFILIIHKKCNTLIHKIKKEGIWKKYGEEIIFIVPLMLINSFLMLYFCLFELIRFFIINEIDLLFGFILFFMLSLISFLSVFLFSSIGKKQKDYEIINLGKLKYQDSKEHIEDILKRLELKITKTGPKNSLKFKADETFLINDDFEVMLFSTVKEELSKIWWPGSIRFTRVIVGKITKDNKKLVRKVQQEIGKLKVNA